MKLDLLKVHGSNNQFFLYDELTTATSLGDAKLAQLAQKLCDKTNGLAGGADGLLVVQPPIRKTAVARMRVINADGSEASMCGNGLRTVARYVSEKLHLDKFLVDTMHQALHVSREANFALNVPAFAVEISPVSFAAKDLLMHVGKNQVIDEALPQIVPALKFSAVAVPNPHLISFGDEQTHSQKLLGQIGEHLNDGKNPYFPDGVNVSFVQVLGERHLFVRTFERGVGFTNACGTAMSASSLMSVLLNKCHANDGDEIVVNNPGGMVKTRVHNSQTKNPTIDLIGNATVMATTSVTLADALAGDFSKATYTENTTEINAYNEFIKNFLK